MKTILTFLISLLCCCASCNLRSLGRYGQRPIPAAPQYQDTSAWAALPWTREYADLLPSDTMHDAQSDARVDVFFVHPTIYTSGRQSKYNWNADLGSKKLNKSVDKSTIKYQASLFNGVGRVYAPRYRQAHLSAFYTKKHKKDAAQALALAYSDVKNAFEYYLKYYNDGRPFILAGHSQGAYHSKQLLKDYVEAKPLRKQLVAAYIPGYPVYQGEYTQLQPCTEPDQVGCFVTWRTYRRSYALKHANQTNVICTNPISWNLDETYVPKSQHQGAVLKKFHQILPQICDAQVYQGVLAVNKPKFRGSAFFILRNYHPGDFNLFYLDVRHNAQLRAERWFMKPK